MVLLIKNKVKTYKLKFANIKYIFKYLEKQF